MQIVGGLAVREAPNDLPTRCYCCSPARQLQTFRNGPNIQLAVCPATRAALILRDNHPVVSSGVFTGAL